MMYRLLTDAEIEYCRATARGQVLHHRHRRQLAIDHAAQLAEMRRTGRGGTCDVVTPELKQALFFEEAATWASSPTN